MFSKKADVSATSIQPLQRPVAKPPFRLDTTGTKKAMDLTNLQAPSPEPVKIADTHYALGDRYPITHLPQVKMAAAYFEEHWKAFPPDDRREYALNLVKRAEELGALHLVGKKADLYGGELTEDPNHIKHAFSLREEFVRQEEHQEVFQKTASLVYNLPSSAALRALHAIDKVAGLSRLYDRFIPDPYASLLVPASEKRASNQFSEQVGIETILEMELEDLARRGFESMRHYFKDDIVYAMRENPVKTFKSLSPDQKKLVVRLAKNIGSTGSATPLLGWGRACTCAKIGQRMTPNFDQELQDVEDLLARYLPDDSQLQPLDESTSVEEADPPDAGSDGHKIHVSSPKLTRNTIFEHPAAHPLVLSLLMLEHFESEWLSWEPEVVEDNITSLFGTVTPLNLGKVMAVQTAFTKTAPWDEWHYFVFVCQAFNELPVDPNEFRPPTAAELAVAVQTLRTLDDTQIYSDEMLAFFKAVLEFEQFFVAPDPLDKLGLQLNLPSFPFDPDKIQAMAKGKQPLEESIEGFQAARLQEVSDALKEWRGRLRSQISVVKRG